MACGIPNPQKLGEEQEMPEMAKKNLHQPFWRRMSRLAAGTRMIREGKGHVLSSRGLTEYNGMYTPGGTLVASGAPWTQQFRGNGARNMWQRP